MQNIINEQQTEAEAFKPINLLNEQLEPAVIVQVEPAKAPDESKTLDEYAKAIVEAHQSAENANRQSKKSGREAIAAAIKAGQFLVQAKEQVGHGNWLKWLKDNCKGISEKTAQRYMTLAKTDRLSDLNQCTSLWQAYMCSGAANPGHLDKNPEKKQDNNHDDANGNQPGDTPEIILNQIQRKFQACKSLYEGLVKTEPELEGNLFDCCNPSKQTPLPILLEMWQYALNDAFIYYGLPTIQVECVRCGRVKEPGEFFWPIYQDVPAYSHRQEWCDECVAHFTAVTPKTDIVKEIQVLTENLTEFKSLSVSDYTFAQKYYQLAGTTVAEPHIIETAEKGIWVPNDLENEGDTITTIERLSPKIVLVKDKTAHQLWNVHRHFMHSAVNFQTPGRYIKFFVVDETSQFGCMVLGIGAVSGDFPALKDRDDFIGWTKEQKEDGKLSHTAIASTIVSMQPFGFNFNGAKLIAALATSREIRDEWQSQYGDVLVGMTTTSLFGVPSMYDQIDEWKRLGETTGRVAIQPKPSIYRKWLDILKDSQAHEFKQLMKQDADVSGPVTNYKMKVLTMIYRAAGIKLADFQHGHKRGIYFAEFYENTRDFLCGGLAENDLKLKPLFQESVQQITDRWREQAIKRYKTLKAAGTLRPEKLSYSQLGRMDFDAAKNAFLDDVGR